ncbi:MAG: pyruvate formate lyase family protein, partial [Promethearchaeota archaeon]
MVTTENKDSSSKQQIYKIAEPHDLSPRNKWLRDYYFLGVKREWNNEYMPFTTGLPNDRQFAESDYYIVPEIYFYLGNKSRGIFSSSLSLMAETVELPKDFWTKSLPERRIIFFEKVMLDKIPQEIIGPELLAGGRFNTQLSKCLNEKEQKIFDKLNLNARTSVFKYHNHGFGNAGAAAGHLIPDYDYIIKNGFKAVYNEALERYNKLSEKEKKGLLGDELRAIIQASEIPRKLAEKYADECRRLANESNDETRKQELNQMAKNLEIVPWEPAQTFWQAVQSLWLIHMLVMSEESYPGPGLSFGRTDQHLWNLYRKDVIDEKIITKDFAKEILGSFWFHCNTAYDAQMRVGNQGITAGFGQLMTLSGCGPNGEDLTNELTYTLLEVIDEWSPILEPKPNVRLHRNSPEKLLDIVVDMITKSQGAPFLLNFDERSIAGMIREGIPKEDAWNYACVGCLENTMQGNDRSGTVNCNPNLVKSVLLTLNNGKSANQNQNVIMLHPKEEKPIQMGLKTGLAENFTTWEEFWNAWVKQIKFQIKYTVETYNISEELRANWIPTPYLSAMVKGCISQGLDVRNGGPEIRFVTIEGVGFATLVDSLLAIKKFVYDEKKFTIAELKEAMENDFKGKKEWEIM